MTAAPTVGPSVDWTAALDRLLCRSGILLVETVTYADLAIYDVHLRRIESDFTVVYPVGAAELVDLDRLAEDLVTVTRRALS